MEPATWWVTGGRGGVAIAALLAWSCGGRAQTAPSDREDPDPPVKQLPVPEPIGATTTEEEPAPKILSGVRTTEMPDEIDGLGVMTARVEGYFNQLVEPSEATKRDLRRKGYDMITVRILVCTNPQGHEVLRRVDRTPYPEWDRKVLAASLEQNIGWMQNPDDRPRCWGWRAWWDLNREPSQP